MAKKFDKNSNFPKNGKGKRQNDGSRYSGSQNGRTTRDESTLDCGKHPNDVSWYAQNPQMLVDSASVAFNQAVGAKYTLEVDGTKHTRLTPGIMTIRWSPSVGYSNEANSPVNIAARNLYSYVRHANSGSANYDSPDLMLYCLATSSAYAWLETMKRAYGVLRFYSQTNRYLPIALSTALGFNADQLSSNLADFRYHINQYALKLNSLAVPNSIPYFQRHMWMNRHVYMDRAGIKAQFYAYRQNGYFRFAEMTEDDPYGRINLASPAPLISTVAQIKNFGDSLLDPILRSESMNIMSGDIMKAFTSSGLMVATEIDENYVVVPEYNSEVLHQMHNTHTVGAVYTDNDQTGHFIHQTPDGYLVSTPKVERRKKDTLTATGNLLLDIHGDTPTPADVMVSTRMMATCLDNWVDHPALPTGFNVADLNICGSEIPSAINIYTFGADGTLRTFDIMSDYVVDQSAGNSVDLNTLVFHSMFDMAPTLYVGAKLQADADPVFISTFGDLDNYVPIDNQVLHNMHQCALLSMFAVPGMGVYAASKR